MSGTCKKKRSKYLVYHHGSDSNESPQNSPMYSHLWHIFLPEKTDVKTAALASPWGEKGGMDKKLFQYASPAFDIEINSLDFLILFCFKLLFVVEGLSKRFTFLSSSILKVPKIDSLLQQLIVFLL